MKRLAVLSLALLLGACSYFKPTIVQVPVAAKAPAAQPAGPVDDKGIAIEVVPFKAGVSSASVEQLARQSNCMGGEGAGLLTPPGPIEVYRMRCQDGRVFKARCEMRQCAVLGIQEPQPGAAQQEMSGGQMVAKLDAKQVPKLKVRWECGECTPNPQLVADLEKAYAKAAADSGKVVVDSASADLVITAYRERSSVVRVMVGILAGKDVLKVKVNYRGRTIQAEDYSANAWTGMSQICATVTQNLVKQL